MSVNVESTPMGTVRPASVRAANMPRSAIREVMALAAGRGDVFHLEVGEPEFGTPDWITRSAFERVRAGATRYTPNVGVTSLREAVAARVESRCGMPVSAERVVITTGAVGALYSALFTVLDEGDDVLLPDPGWPNYSSIAHLAGARVVRFSQPAERGFLPSVAEIERLIGPRTKAILINTPCNPTGAVFPRPLMEGIGRLVARHGIYLICDEVYEDFTFDGPHVGALEVAPADRTFLVSGVSKSYAMTGWRIGYLVAPPQLASTVGAIQEPVTSCPSAPSQAAAEAALTGKAQDVSLFREIYRRRRDVVAEVFAGTQILPVVPQGAFYAFLDIGERQEGSLVFTKRLLAERGVACVPGVTFGPGSDRFLRIAFTIDDSRLLEALTIIRSELA